MMEMNIDWPPERLARPALKALWGKVDGTGTAG